MTYAALMAQLGPQDHPYLLYAVIGGIVVLATVVRSIIGSVKDWQELRLHSSGSDCVTRAELREVHGRVDEFAIEIGKIRGEVTQSISGFADKVNDALKDVSEQLGGVQRSLGRVEGLERIIDEHGKDIDQLQGRPARYTR
jgi:hypothetical protein